MLSLKGNAGSDPGLTAPLNGWINGLLRSCVLGHSQMDHLRRTAFSCKTWSSQMPQQHYHHLYSWNAYLLRLSCCQLSKYLPAIFHGLIEYDYLLLKLYVELNTHVYEKCFRYLKNLWLACQRHLKRFLNMTGITSAQACWKLTYKTSPPAAALTTTMASRVLPFRHYDECWLT